MEVHLLGAVQAWADGRSLDLGPRKQRLAFAVLSLHVNQLVTVKRLVDLTWTDSPPPTAHHAIHVRVSALRTMLARTGGPEILTRGSAYVLRADPLCVDAHRFRALVVEARAEIADADRVTLFRRALDLWNGPPLADVASPDVVGQLCRSLEETRLTANEECLDAELRLGRHRVIVDELVGLTAQHPYRQRLLAQLMLALYRAGRAPEALGVYNDARRRLVGELGLDPEPPLRELQHSILISDPALDLPRAARHGVRTRPRAAPSAAESIDQGEITIEARGLSKRFGSRTALADLTFAGRAGEVIGLLGPSGTGKTTAIRLLSTVLTPTSGEFSVAGVPCTRPAEIRRRVGVVPERAGYPAHQTGREYLRYHARLFGLPRRDTTMLADHLLTEVGLTGPAADRIATYTRSMRRRLGIARALVNSPLVMFLDEPTLGLDPPGRHHVLAVVRDIVARRGATVVLSSHDPSELDELCTCVLELARHRAVAGQPWVPTHSTAILNMRR